MFFVLLSYPNHETGCLILDVLFAARVGFTNLRLSPLLFARVSKMSSLTQFQQLFRSLLFDGLEDNGQRRDWWFVGQQMNVLWHQNVSCYDETVALAYLFQFLFKSSVCVGRVEEWESSMTTEGYEVELA
jgi:hypothetical protein